MQNRVTKAMVLAAGEGTRLRPLTLETPKPLIPIAGIPLIEHILRWLASHGIHEAAINLCHRGDKIRAYLGEVTDIGMKIVYSQEDNLLGTAGGVKKMEPFFDGTFIVFYGDNLTDFDLTAMIEYHYEKVAAATIAVFETPRPWEAGILKLNEDKTVVKLVEKPQPDAGLGNLANGGVYILERDILQYIPEGFADFAYDVFPRVLEAGLPVYGYQLSKDDYFIDIGTMVNYNKANTDATEGRIRLLSSRP